MTYIINIKQKLYPYGFRHDASKLAGTTFVFIISSVLSSWMIATVSLVFIGRLGETALDGAALALTVYALVGTSIVVGLNFGCDTLLPQCYGGNKHKMGIILQRGIIIAFYACFIVWTFMLNAKYVLKWIENDKEIIAVTNEFLQFFLLMVPFDALSVMLRVYIANTGRIQALIYINVFGNLVNILSHFVCIYYFDLGIRSAPLSITVAYGSIVLCSVLYIRFTSIYEETWHPVSRECLGEWSVYLKLAIPGVLSIIVENWSIELSEFFAASIGNRSLSAQVVVQQTVFLLYLITTSLGDAGNILIGQYLGANKPREAANAKNVTYTLGIILVLFNILIMLLSYRWLPYLFNVTADVMPLARNGLLLGAVANIFDGLNAVQTSIVKACGMQKYACILLFIGFFFIQLPLSFILMFIVNLDIYGFWIAMILSEMLIDILLFVLIWRFDWTTFSKEALDNIRFSEKSEDSKMNSLSSENMNEHMELLPSQYSEKNYHANINKDNTLQMESIDETSSYEQAIPEKPLFKSMCIKVVVLVLFICVFMVSFIISVRTYNYIYLRTVKDSVFNKSINW